MKHSKVIKKVLSVIMAAAMLAAMTSCKFLEGINLDISVKGRSKTTEDGFVYFVGYKEGEKDKVYIISLPDSEEVTIPEYIDGKKVVQIGYLEQGIGYRKEHYVDFSKVKKLTIQHPITYSYVNNYFSIETMVFIDYFYCKSNMPRVGEKKTIYPVLNYYASKNNFPKIVLIKSKRKNNYDYSYIKEILIPKYVMQIDIGVFTGFEGVSIKTEYESKPDGWEDGWNGTCEVEWGVNLSEGE